MKRPHPECQNRRKCGGIPAKWRVIGTGKDGVVHQVLFACGVDEESECIQAMVELVKRDGMVTTATVEQGVGRGNG